MEPTDIDGLQGAFDLQIAWCDASGTPFTANMLRVLRANVTEGGALAPLVVPWPGNARADAVPLRLAGALHFLVLTGRAPALAAFYPQQGARTWDMAAVAREVEVAAVANFAVVRDTVSRPPQTNEVARSAVLMPGYAEIAKETGLPLRVLELGPSAGLNMLWDRYAYRYGDHFVGGADAPLVIDAGWRGPWSGVTALPDVVERRGCDRSPIDISRPESAERLMSYVWPEQTERLERLGAAIAVARQEKPIIDTADAAEWLERQLAAPRDGVATVVVHTIVWQYFTKETAARAKAALDAAGARATREAPLAWLSLEQYAADRMPELRLTLWPGGERRMLANAHPHGAWIEWLGAQA